MKKRYFAAIVISLAAISTANAQVKRGVMTVTGAEMHWWAGVARGAIARLYDVDDDSVIFKRFNLKNRYDSATVTFRAKQGKLIDLKKMHESIWATRLSGGTKSGAICLEVTVEGTVSQSGDKTILKIDGTNQHFVLVSDVRAKPEDATSGALKALLQAAAGGQKNVSITGFVDGWVGRWPGVLARPTAKQPRLMVTRFQPVKQDEE